MFSVLFLLQTVTTIRDVGLTYMPRFFINIFFFFFLFAVFANEDKKAFFLDDEPIVFTKAEILNEHTARIPFKLVDHLMVIEAELLNKKGDFIVDTGSETLILNKVHFLQQYQHRKKRKKTTGVIESIENSSQKKLKEFVLKNFNLKNKISDVIDLSHIEKLKKMNVLGIIGYSILVDYEVFIDMHLNQITLSKVDRNGNKLNQNVYAETIIDSIDFKLRKHTIVLNCFVNNQNVKFGLDSAAEFNQINKSNSKKVLKYFYPDRRLLLGGASKNKIEVVAGKLYRVKLSKTIYFGPMNTVLTNLSNMREAFGTDLDGVLGYEFFAQKRTIINYQKEKLYFVKYPIRFH